MLDALQRHDPDPLRYYHSHHAGNAGQRLELHGYVERNNNELVANWGNLVNRVLNMMNRYFGGVVPEPAALGEKDRALLAAIDAGFDEIGALYDAARFRAAAQETMALATKVNQYLEETSPWKTANEDREATACSLYTALQAINGLKVLFAPILPFTSERLHQMLGLEGQLFGHQLVREFSEEPQHRALVYDASAAKGEWLRRNPAWLNFPNPAPSSASGRRAWRRKSWRVWYGRSLNRCAGEPPAYGRQ